MPPASKKLKLSETANSSVTINDELQSLQNEINKIKETGSPVEDHDEIVINNKLNSSYVIVDESIIHSKNLESSNENQFEELKKFIRDQIRLSERRIQNRFDIIEGKLNRLLDRQTAQSGEEEEFIEEEHVYEVDDNAHQPTFHQSVEVSEQDFKIFPICDEQTFDWFFDRLKNEDYRNSLIQRRWNLTKTVNMKSLKISVKDFLLMHFDLSVCIKYSISGFGAHGIRKKKLDSNSLNIFVYECFNLSSPDQNPFPEISKAIVQFWGRTPEYLSRANERAVKHEFSR